MLIKFEKSAATSVFLLILIGTTPSLRVEAQQLPSEVIAYADMVLYNGKVLTVDESFSVAEAVAIRDGKFLAVGETARILAMAGPNTRKIDLLGKTVTPGFIDTHLHQAWVAQYSKSGLEGRVRFADVASGLEEIKKIVERTPPGEWIFLSGPRNKVMFTVTRQDLDPISPDNPVAISLSTAEAVINTAAMKAAGIRADIPGVLTDSQTGEPNGQVRQAAVGILSYEMKPEKWPNIGQLVPQQKERLFKYAAQGLTTIMGRAQGTSISVLRELWEQGDLPTRVRIAHEFIMYNPNPEAYLRRVGNLRNLGDDWMRIIGLTVGPVDGISPVGGILTFRPKLREAKVAGGDVFFPFGQNKWSEGHEGEEDWTKYSTERKAVILANRYGWNVTAQHSTGDLSTSIYLDAYEEARREKPLEGRWGLDHMEWQTPDTIRRMKELEIIPSFYARMFMNPENQIYQYGPDRLQETVPIKTMIDAGLKPVAEADTGPSKYSAPLFLIQKFITRTDEKGRIWNAKEAITLEQALRMYTSWAARYSQEEEKLGSVEPGKLADLVVLDGDLIRVEADQISAIPVVMTVVGGNVIYDRERDGVIDFPSRER